MTLPVLPGETDLEQFADPGEFVVLACGRAKEWLAQALEHGDIDNIVELKSQAEAIRVYATQKQLGKDAELAAAEIVRRAERGIGVAIRKGQEAGEIRRKGEHERWANQHHSGGALHGEKKTSPSSYFSGGGEEHAVRSLAEVPDEEFEQIIEEAKEEHNLSRANVVRKVKGQGTAESRVAKAKKMAAEGATSRQIAKAIGINPDNMGAFRSRHGIEVPADSVVGKSRRLDADRVVQETVNVLEGLAIGADLIDVADLDPDQRGAWASSMQASLRVLNQLARDIKGAL